MDKELFDLIYQQVYGKAEASQRRYNISDKGKERHLKYRLKNRSNETFMNKKRQREREFYWKNAEKKRAYQREYYRRTHK